QFAPLQTYTENCLNDVGKRGLVLLGQQGGYIYPELVGEYSASNPTDADGLDLEPTKIPYWHYNVEPNKGGRVTFSSLQPKLYAKEDAVMSVEAQLSRFVQEQLNGCLQRYESFFEEGYRVVAEEPEVEVRIGEESVNFHLSMKVKARQGESEHQMDEFFVKVPLRLKHYYEVAQEIATAEKTYFFIEKHLEGILASYSGLSSERLPPYEYLSFEIVPPAFWNELQVKENLRRLLVSQVPMLRYLGSTQFYRYEYPAVQNGAEVADLSKLYQQNYDNSVIPLELGNDLEVNFDYFNWEPYFDMTDIAGRIGPSTHQTSIFQFTVNRYHNSYDVSYPLQITVRDANALHGQGYSFVFALEANMRNNEVVKDGYQQPPLVARSTLSMMCDDNKRFTEPVKTIILDGSTKKPVADVQVLFSIPEQDDCMMGMTNDVGVLETSYPAVYGGIGSYMKEGYFSNFYPIDTYPYKKQSGIIGYAVADAVAAGFSTPVVEIYPKKSITVEVEKKNLVKCIESPDIGVNKGILSWGGAVVGAVLGVGPFVSAIGAVAGASIGSSIGDITVSTSAVCFSGGIPGKPALLEYTPSMRDEDHHWWQFIDLKRKLSPLETATLTFTRVADINPALISDDFTTLITVNGNESGRKEIELVPGVYQITGIVTSKEKLLIPKEERCTGGVLEAIGCFDLSGCCNTFDSITLEEYIAGQLSWNIPETYLTITPDQLYGSDKVTFYVLGWDEAGVPIAEHMRVVEDLKVMSQLGNFSAQPGVRKRLEPMWG
ncbi:glycine zipper family protein, partial [Candidatus Woesearchaeota archaeon]|nr:glycine zipper family protein [Candidatus Woesearchaeota archaeon]